MANIIAIYPDYIIVDGNPELGSGTASDIGVMAIANDNSGVFYKYGISDKDWASYGIQRTLALTSLGI